MSEHSIVRSGDGRVNFSVVVPTFNRCEFLVACLESIRAQTLQPYEVIVVDDGSTDGTQSFLAAQRDIKFIKQENNGPGAARNSGALAATGQYLAFLDSDDIWSPKALEIFSDVIISRSCPSLIFARYFDFDGQKASPHFDIMSPIVEDYFANFAASNAEDVYAGAGMMVIETSAFRNAGGFLEDRLNAEDHDLALAMSDAPGFVHIRLPATIAHRIHSGNAMADQKKTVLGVLRLVAREQSGDYPGGSSLAPARRRIIARHARAAVLGSAQQGHASDAATLFWLTVPWQLQFGRFRFIAAAIVALARHSIFSRRAIS